MNNRNTDAPSLLLTKPEAELLEDLIGCPIDLAMFDGCAAYLESGERGLCFYPEEAHTPTAEHPHACINRPAVEVFSGELPPPPHQSGCLARSLGVVTEVAVLHTLVAWSASQPMGPTKQLKTEIPAGVQYGPIFHNPLDGVTAGPEWFPTDIGVVVCTTSEQSVVLFTQAVGYWVELLIADAEGTIVCGSGFPVDILDSVQVVPLTIRLQSTTNDSPG
jgi:hypothetical protein